MGAGQGLTAPVCAACESFHQRSLDGSGERGQTGARNARNRGKRVRYVSYGNATRLDGMESLKSWICDHSTAVGDLVVRA